MTPQYTYNDLIELLSTDFGRYELPDKVSVASTERLMKKLADGCESLAARLTDPETRNRVIKATEHDKELVAEFRALEFSLWALERTVARISGEDIFTDAPPAPPAPAPRPQKDRPRSAYRAQIGTIVYVARAITEEILYVGITDNLFSRMAQHQRQSRWWDSMDSLSWEEWPDRDAALQQEERLIKRHRPPFNTTHNPDRRSPM
jgi:predicted GIY-YIG superfamily endonuclease